MIIPWGTDAPIYHWPKATVGLIAANVAAFALALSLDEETFATWCLQRGAGIHPIQWVSTNFMHLDAIHLIGNMLFLWAFGIVVEGKLGWSRFLVVYLGIGVIYGAVLQIGSLGAKEGVILGASGVIYGLMAICLVWAPRNELNCIWFVRFLPQQVDISIFWFAIGYIGLEAAMVTFTAGRMSSALLHLTGAVVGFAIGSVFVLRRIVDCEGWDLYSLTFKNRELKKKWKDRGEWLERVRETNERAARSLPKVRDVEREAEAQAGNKSDAALKKVQSLLDMGDLDSALSAYDRAARTIAKWPGSEGLLGLIKAFHTHEQPGRVASITLMRDYIRRNPELADRMRLKLAQVLIKDRAKPTQALRVLSEVSATALPSELMRAHAALEKQAAQMQAEGVLELEGDD